MKTRPFAALALCSAALALAPSEANEVALFDEARNNDLVPVQVPSMRGTRRQLILGDIIDKIKDLLKLPAKIAEELLNIAGRLAEKVLDKLEELVRLGAAVVTQVIEILQAALDLGMPDNLTNEVVWAMEMQEALEPAKAAEVEAYLPPGQRLPAPLVIPGMMGTLSVLDPVVDDALMKVLEDKVLSDPTVPQLNATVTLLTTAIVSGGANAQALLAPVADAVSSGGTLSAAVLDLWQAHLPPATRPPLSLSVPHLRGMLESTSDLSDSAEALVAAAETLEELLEELPDLLAALKQALDNQAPRVLVKGIMDAASSDQLVPYATVQQFATFANQTLPARIVAPPPTASPTLPPTTPLVAPPQGVPDGNANLAAGPGAGAVVAGAAGAVVVVAAALFVVQRRTAVEKEKQSLGGRGNVVGMPFEPAAAYNPYGSRSTSYTN